MMRIINKDSILTISESNPNNLILFDKPANWTSFDVVKKVKNIGHFKKAGHAGTLDPFATGLLIVGTGNETKKLSTWSDADKTYYAEIEFGKKTDTFDVTGRVTEEKSISKLNWNLVQSVIDSFIGITEQLPPMFSAKKIKGVRLYKLARQGKEIERKPQNIRIDKIHIMDKADNRVNIEIQCSKGTYVRSIAHDIGLKTGYGAYLKSLIRTRIGNFFVKDALSIGQFESFWRNLN